VEGDKPMTLQEAEYVLETFDNSKMLKFIAKRAVNILRGELSDALQVVVLQEESEQGN
jgi:hypothetical protein